MTKHNEIRNMKVVISKATPMQYSSLIDNAMEGELGAAAPKQIGSKAWAKGHSI